MKQKVVTVVAWLLFLQGAIVFAGVPAHLPPAPKGYSWRWFESIKAGLLVPQGWFVKEESKAGTHAFFITKKSIEKGSWFKTGFSLNVVQNSSKKTGVPPSEYAKQFINKMASTTQSSEVRPVGDGTHFKGYGGFFRSRPAKEEIVVQYTLTLGNDKTGTLYICTFESPEREWSAAWKLGSAIIDNLALETEF